MQDVIFVINPHASSGRAARVWSALKAHSAPLRAARCIMAESSEEARSRLLAQLHGGIRRVVVVGGDGTVNATAGTLLECRHPAILGLVPVGSGSDTARGLRLTHHPGPALNQALNGAPRALDALYFTQQGRCGWVVNIASVGISGLVADSVNTLGRRWAGTYLWTALKALHRYAATGYRIELDGRPWFQGPVLLCAVANGSAFARGMRIAPNAASNDGLADIVLVKAVPLRQALPWVPRLYTGGHLRAPFVQTARARCIAIEPLEPGPAFETDGEPLPAATTRFSVVPGALQVAY